MYFGQSVTFGPFRFDIETVCHWREEQAVALTPKALAVFGHLVRHAGRLVTKQELLDEVWQDVAVSDAVLKVGIRAIRRALGDQARTPQFIETVYRRGYRFIAPLHTGPQPIQSPESEGPSPRSVICNPPWSDLSTDSATNLVGREAERAQLHEFLEKALSGKRQIV